MISGYRRSGRQLEEVPTSAESLRDLVWIDLEAPSPEEEKFVESVLEVEVPTREDMLEIEPSSRIYHGDHALYLTAQVLASPAPDTLEIAPVTFMIQPERLITVHYHHPGSFTFFAEWAAHHDIACTNGMETFLNLLEAVVDRLADILEAEARVHEQLSKEIFASHRGGDGDHLSSLINRIGTAEDHNSKINESLATIQRILGFLAVPGSYLAKELAKTIGRDQLKSLAQDVRSLREVAKVHSEKIRFQLDATLGVINIRQSDVIKIFSVVAFVFLPPTLIASIYGMNFEYMPELKWDYGYPAALGLMVVSAVVPWLIFRWKKWL